jgi:hypothetical protein
MQAASAIREVFGIGIGVGIGIGFFSRYFDPDSDPDTQDCDSSPRCTLKPRFPAVVDYSPA